MQNQITGGLDVSALQPAPLRAFDQDGQTVFKDQAWNNNGEGEDQEAILFDTKTNRFVLRIITKRPHAHNTAYFWISPAQAVCWTIERFGGARTVKAAKHLVARLNAEGDVLLKGNAQ